MDLIKQYIVQSISAASNNLRLSTQKIEVVALLRESIAKADDLEFEIKEMKKVTELSKFAIRLHEIYNYLAQPHVDFFKISDRFKEHSQFLIKDLSSLLENVNPASFKNALFKIHPAAGTSDQIKMPEETVINIDLSKRDQESVEFEKSDTDTMKEKIIMEDDKEEDEEFHNYELRIMAPVKPLDNFLQKLESGDYNPEILKDFRRDIKNNAELSSRQGFDLIAGMHEILADALGLIIEGKMIPEKGTIECIRACLIVIVAVVRGKELDITGYLNRAEEFGRELQKYK